MSFVRRRGRPLGVIAQSLLDAVHTQPATVNDLAMRLQVSFTAARYTVARLAQAGRVEYGPRLEGTRGRQVLPAVRAAVVTAPALAHFRFR